MKMDDIEGPRAKRGWVAWPSQGPCHLVSFKPRGPPRLLLMPEKVLIIKY
jgi:hypothetical protein